MTKTNKDRDYSHWEVRDRPNNKAALPYAYIEHPDDPLKAIPDMELVPWVEEALDQLDQGRSYRETAAWLTEKSGHPISHQGIANIWKRLRGRKKSPRSVKQREVRKATEPATKEEKAALEARRMLAGAKRALTVRTRKLEELQGKVEQEEVPFNTPTVSDGLDFTATPKEREVIFAPNPGPQTDFLAASEREVLYGGSAGGGKSYALLADPMRYFANPNFAGIVFRRTNDELRELIWKSQEIYPRAYPGARWQEKKSQWVFPNGGRLWFTYLERDEDVLRYQGQAFCVAVGTRVLMADGSYRAVELLKEGDLVQTLEGPQPLEWVSKRMRKKCVKVTSYDSEGHQLGVQLQPYTHPIALLSSKPYSELSDLCRTVGQFRSSPLEWLSAEHLESLAQESRETSVSVEDDQSDCTKSEGGPQESVQPRGYFYPAVLHAPYPQSVPSHDATQCHTCGKSSLQLSETALDYSVSSSDHSQPSVLDQSHMDRSKVLFDQSYDDASYAPKSKQTTVDSQSYCPSCYRLYDGRSPLETELGQVLVPSQDDVEVPAHGDLHADETDCIPSHSRYLRKQYIHPYTQEQRHLAVPASVGIVHVEPTQLTSYCDVIDLTVKSSNHYITESGIVNQNCYIGFDELTQHPTPFAWDYMRSRLRTTDPTLPLFMRATTNPGGPGHGWVKRMFIDPAPAGKAFPAQDLDTGEALRYPDTHANAGKALFYRRFIPATLKDNPYLFEGGQYEANLLSLPEMQRRQLLEGDWTIAQGAAFPEFRTSTHVVEPFDIPRDWRRFRSCDYGYSSHSAVHWFAIDPNYETLYVYRELYVSKHTGKDLARAVMDAERGEQIDYGVLDSSTWHQRGQLGPSIAEEMISMGCRWRPSDRSAGARVSGKNRFHEVLKIDPATNMPGIVFFNTCRQIIADLPVIPSDPKGGDDIDPRYASDHSYDSVRYGIMSRPRGKSPWEDWNNGVPKTNRWKPVDTTFGY